MDSFFRIVSFVFLSICKKVNKESVVRLLNQTRYKSFYLIHFKVTTIHIFVKFSSIYSVIIIIISTRNRFESPRTNKQLESVGWNNPDTIKDIYLIIIIYAVYIYKRYILSLLFNSISLFLNIIYNKSSKYLYLQWLYLFQMVLHSYLYKHISLIIHGFSLRLSFFSPSPVLRFSGRPPLLPLPVRDIDLKETNLVDRIL